MVDGRAVEAVLVAGGSSTRMGFDKLFYKIDGVEVLLLAFRALQSSECVDKIVVVTGEGTQRARALIEGDGPGKPVTFVRGGDCRAASVAAGVAACDAAALVAVHDAARPFVSRQLIERVVCAAAGCGAAAPALPVKDTVKQAREGVVVATLLREELAAVQTPQVFDCAAYRQALKAIPAEEWPLLTDDCMVMERAGKQVCLVEGDAANDKITTVADLPPQPQCSAAGPPRVGHGYDVHAFAAGRRLVLGGVEVPFEKGLLGHSDADVLLHAVSDALLGAAALGDIGRHFPDSDPAYKDADSLRLLEEVGGLVGKAGFAPTNLDVTIVCQAPKLAPHILAMRRNIAGALGLSPAAVNVKATTEEGLGFTGRGEGIAAHCVALLVPM